MNFIPNTAEDRKRMLEEIGFSSVDQLFDDIPQEVREKAALSIPGGLSELEVRKLLGHLSKKNGNLDDYVSFLGAGAYDHYIPSPVDQIVLRSEFYTAYTPYQPEISQGTLQAIFEYQTLICELTGMEVANASMYDGASAMAEAAYMACQSTRRNKVVVSGAIHPEYLEVLETYTKGLGIQVEQVDFVDGVTPADQVETKVDKDTACVIVQQPNFFGNIEQLQSIAQLAHREKALLVTVVVDPVTLGILKPPGELGADIVVGEGQSFGNNLNFGGPYLGFFAAREKYVRRMPGRIVGQTVDVDGKTGYVLTLQAREQHIRREKATSNICSNEALCALAATITLCCFGKQGLKRMAQLSLQKAHYAFDKLIALSGVEAPFKAPFCTEFVLSLPADPDKVNQELLRHKIIGGLPLKRFFPSMQNEVLISVTEMRTKEEIDNLAEIMGGIK